MYNPCLTLHIVTHITFKHVIVYKSLHMHVITQNALHFAFVTMCKPNGVYKSDV